MIISNFTDNYTSSSYNIQQKGRYHTFNSYRNELSEIFGLRKGGERIDNKNKSIYLNDKIGALLLKVGHG